MAEYIEREAAKNAIMDYIGEQTMSKYTDMELCRASRMGAEGAMYEIDYVPAADVVEVRYGEWVRDGDFLVCLNCEGEINVKNSLGVENHKNYCPNCGAKMDGETK